MDFDLHAYRLVKPCLKAKDWKLAQNHARVLRQFPARAGMLPLSVLDVGTGDGGFFAKICAIYAHSSPAESLRKLRLEMVEPHPYAGSLQVGSLNSHARLFDQAAFLRKKVEALKGANANRQYDVVLCTHLFYHLPRHQWLDIIDTLRRRLKPHGCLRIVLVSVESWPYLQVEELESRSEESRLVARPLGEGGSFIFAEDLEADLIASGMPFSRERVFAHLSFGNHANRTSVVQSPMARGLRFEVVCRFVAFVLRRSVDSIIALGRPWILKLLAMGHFAPLTVDHVFQIWRNDS